MRLNRWLLLLSLFLATTFSLGEDIAPGKSGDELVEHLRAEYQPTSIRSYDDARFEMFSNIDNEDGKQVLVYTGEEFATTGIPDHRVVNTEHPWPQSKFNERMPRRAPLRLIRQQLAFCGENTFSSPPGMDQSPDRQRMRR